MKQAILTSVLASAIMMGSHAIAQDAPPPPPKAPKPLKEKREEIIINKSGDGEEKMTIVVDGENVTINGKPAGEMKGGNVKIIKRKKMGGSHPEIQLFGAPGDLEDIDVFSEMPPMGVNKAMLGIMSSKGENGAVVTEVSKESGAEKAGIKKDDIITKVGDTKIADPQDLTEAIGKYKPNDKVEIVYKRNGKEAKTTATLTENKGVRKKIMMKMDDDDFHFDMPEGVRPPDMRNFSFRYFSKPKMGMQIQDVEEGKGVKVKEVEDDMPAAKAGLKEGDIITQINGKDISGVDNIRETTAELKEGETVKITFIRDGKTQTTDLKIPKKLKTADL